MRTSTKPPTNTTVSRPVPVLSRTTIFRVIGTHRPDRKSFVHEIRTELSLHSVLLRGTRRMTVRNMLGAVRTSVQCGPACAHRCTFSHCRQFGMSSVPTAPRADNWQRFIWPLLQTTVMRRLTTGIRSEKCVVMLFRRCANVVECTYTNLDSITYYKPGLYGIAYYS